MTISFWRADVPPEFILLSPFRIFVRQLRLISARAPRGVRTSIPPTSISTSGITMIINSFRHERIIFDVSRGRK